MKKYRKRYDIFRRIHILPRAITAPAATAPAIIASNCCHVTKLPITENNLTSEAPSARIRYRTLHRIMGRITPMSQGTVPNIPCVYTRLISPVTRAGTISPLETLYHCKSINEARIRMRIRLSCSEIASPPNLWCHQR